MACLQKLAFSCCSERPQPPLGMGSFYTCWGITRHPYHALGGHTHGLALMVLMQKGRGAARMPVDDPATHLKLTMIHEVMVLDHSGPPICCVRFRAH